MGFYKGFSTIVGNKWKLEDIELVKRDLLNHFNTRKGERYDPTFGSEIWELVFDQMTPQLRDQIIADATAIVDFDPRVVSNGITIQEFEHGFQISMDLYYVNEDLTDTLFLQFNQKTNKLTSL